MSKTKQNKRAYLQGKATGSYTYCACPDGAAGATRPAASCGSLEMLHLKRVDN